MTEKRPLFRPEAVEHHARAQGGTRTLDMHESRTVWLFRGLLAALLVTVGLAFVIPAETTAHGVAVTDDSGGHARVAIGDLRRIEPGQAVTLDVAGTKVHGTVESIETGGTVEAPVVVALAQKAPPGTTAKAAVKLGRMSVARLLLDRH